MSEIHEMKVIARIHSAFATKFGIPRQSGLVDELRATVVFEPEYRNEEALRGIEGFSHIWLIWQFSGAVRKDWSPTVRPPRLGGNTRMGVFATRSPFRPNAVGLSSVRLLGVKKDEEHGCMLEVAGADLMDGTPIYDIKPYVPYADCHPEAVGGFASEAPEKILRVAFPNYFLDKVPEEHRAALIAVLENDPRPRYQKDPSRVYGFVFAGLEVRFAVAGQVLTVCSVEPAAAEDREDVPEEAVPPETAEEKSGETDQ